MSKLVVLGCALALLAVNACESDAGGGAPAPTASPSGGVGMTAPGRGGASSAGDGGGEGTACTGRGPADAPFGCRPVLAEQLALGCQAFVSCAGFMTATHAAAAHEVTCAYRPDGTLAWARRCGDDHTGCAAACITSTGAPGVLASCPMPIPCRDAGSDGSADRLR